MSQDYTYGMNGQLKEGEVFNGFMSADNWGYDSRLGRRWEIDPISYEWQSPYATFNNNPIYFADPYGLEGGPAKLKLDYDVKNDDGGNGNSGNKGLPSVNGKHGPWATSYLSNLLEVKPNCFLKAEKLLAQSSPQDLPRFMKAASIRYSSIVKQRPEAILVGDIDVYGESYASIEYDFNSCGECCYIAQAENFFQNDFPEVGAGESVIPIWGSGKQMINDINDGDVSGAMLNGAVAASDIFVMKSVVQGIGKGGIRMLTKNYKGWSSYRKAYGKAGFALPKQEVHHAILKRNGATSSSGFNWWLKNQQWNLMPMKPQTIEGIEYTAAQVHQGLHGKGVLKNMSNWQKLIYGTPSWTKPAATSTIGHIILLTN